MVPGVRVHGETVTDVEVALDAQFRPVPVPTLAGIPLLFKAMPSTGRDDDRIRMNVIVRFMADPATGFAPMDWQYGGALGPAPPVLLARRDGRPFSSEDWYLVEDFMSTWSDRINDIMDEAEKATTSLRLLKPPKLQNFARNYHSQTGLLDLRFPAGSTVKAEGLSVQALNGIEGEVMQYSRDRVGVQFPGRPAPVAIKPERLSLLRENPLPSQEPAPQAPAPAPRTDQDRQKATMLCKAFVDCLFQDVFPPKDMCAFFGLEDDVTTRMQDVLGTWRSAIFLLELKEEALVDALLAGRVKELFEDWCSQVAQSGNARAARLLEGGLRGLAWKPLF